LQQLQPISLNETMPGRGRL